LCITKCIKLHGNSGFPENEIRLEMNKLGKSLSFGPGEIQELLELRYGQPLTFSALSLLFPHLDFSHHFHIDHVYPKSELTISVLQSLHFTPPVAESMNEMCNQLPNLQLLQGAINIQKQAQSPANWANAAFTPAQLPSYLATNMLGTLPSNQHGFDAFFVARRALLEKELTILLK
jgi:hypothetical protein